MWLFGVLGAWWDFSGGRNGDQSSSFFVDLLMSAFVSLCISFFSIGFGYATTPICSLYYVVDILI
jgi:hypothetical protein